MAFDYINLYETYIFWNQLFQTFLTISVFSIVMMNCFGKKQKISFNGNKWRWKNIGDITWRRSIIQCGLNDTPNTKDDKNIKNKKIVLNTAEFQRLTGNNSGLYLIKKANRRARDFVVSWKKTYIFNASSFYIQNCWI